MSIDFDPLDYLTPDKSTEPLDYVIEIKKNIPKKERKLDKICDYLYLGDSADAIDLDTLNENKIVTIINCTYEIKNHYPGRFQYRKLHVDDDSTEKIEIFFDQISDIIKKRIRKKEAVFVHCQMGMSRSVTIVIAYLMKHKIMSFKDAFTLVKGIRKIAQPNPSFIKQLENYEKKLYSKNQNLLETLVEK